MYDGAELIWVIERILRSRRYRVAARGIRIALCYQRTYARVLRPT